MIDPLGIGKIINDKFAQIGENVLGTVIDQIVDNSSAHLSSLNDFQSSSIMKLLRKVAGSKFLNKQPIVEVEPNIYAVRDEESNIFKSVHESRSLGIMTISVRRAIISPMGFNRNIRNFVIRENAEWVFELALQGQMLVSQPVSSKDFVLEIPVNSPVLLSPNKSSGSNCIASPDEKHDSKINTGVENRNSAVDKDKFTGVGAREVFFNFKESFQISDISSDINLDLICRIPIQCKPINNQFTEEVVDEDCYFSKNSESSFDNECDEDSPPISDGNSLSGSVNAESTPNIGSNPPLNTSNHSVSFRINQEQNNSSRSSFKQYKIIRIEKTKPNCKEVLDKTIGESYQNLQDTPLKDKEWEVLYECIHFGKVTIPISCILHDKLSSLPILNYKLHENSFYRESANIISGILGKSKYPKSSNDLDDNLVSKSNTMEEWTILHGRKINPCDTYLNKFSRKVLEKDRESCIERESTLRSRFRCEKQFNSERSLTENEKNIENQLDIESSKEIKESGQIGMYPDDICLSWYHLYPKASEMAKYVRPVPGITEYGLSNPIKTLGFIQIGINFETEFCSKVSLLSSTCWSILTVKPITRWIIPTGFEPQYFQMYAESLKILLEHYPRWVPKFLFLLNFRIPRSRFDRVIIFLFWVIIVHGAFHINGLTSFLWIFMFILPCLISLSYRFGSQTASRVHQDFLTRINLVEQERKSIANALQQKGSPNVGHKCNANQNNNTTYINSASGNIWKIFQPILNMKYNSSIASDVIGFNEDSQDLKFSGSNKKDDSASSKIMSDIPEKKSLSKIIPKEVYFGDKIICKEYCTPYDVCNGDGYVCLARTLNNSAYGNKEKDREEELKRLNLATNDESCTQPQFEGQAWEMSQDPKEDFGQEKALDGVNDERKLGQNINGNGGIVQTPFGELRLGIRIPYDDKVVSIFFDDQDLEPVQTQLSNLLTIVELVQQSFASISTLLMKLKNSLNFEDPLIPFLTLSILFGLTITLNLIFYVLSTIVSNKKATILLRGILLIKSIYWLLMRDPFNQVQLEIFNKKQRLGPIVFGKNHILRYLFNRYLKIISHEDRNMFTFINTMKIYDYYPDRFLYRKGTSSATNSPSERIKERRRGMFDPIRILSISVEEYLFFYLIKFSCMQVILLGSLFNSLQYIFTIKITSFFARILHQWWDAIPDIREIQHRCIASTQLIGNLDDLLYDHEDNLTQFKVINGNSYGISGSNKFEEVKPEMSGVKADLFLKQFYFGKNSNYIKKSATSSATREQTCQETDILRLPDSSKDDEKCLEQGLTLLSSKKSLIEYILPINKDQNLGYRHDSNPKSDKVGSSQSSYEVLESLLEGIYPTNKSKKQD
ncbi:coiled coil-containing protein [Cryptosporidium canis]|uniref:Coiled coil-containing protein n=1 Tax=Cryptosporidium canis TaxID=195482 RepID=A0A9D5DHK5_9CRYT|nr:coiled coil-containing protein [Cryptosporidium canis]